MLPDRDQQIARHMAEYCEEIMLAVEHFGKDETKFLQDPVYRNACAMPLMQIGELAKKLTDSFVQEHDSVPWKAIKGMRNLFAHDYRSMDERMIWKTITRNIPDLQAFLESYLQAHSGK